MSQTQENPLLAFQWSPQPAAEALVRSLVDDFLRRNTFAAAFARRMTTETGTRFYDWISSIGLAHSTEMERQLRAAGFESEYHSGLFRNPNGVFPSVCLSDHSGGIEISLKVDSVADFLAVNQLELPIEGWAFDPFRTAIVAANDSYSLRVSEGRTDWPHQPRSAAHHHEMFRRRKRDFPTDAEGFAHANQLIDAAIRELGPDQTCALFFAAEREFWQRKNRAAQVQKARQDRLGLGWGNHDHHTYRSSRSQFKSLIAFFEKLGFECRERFYAGKEAGWGAQIMENPRTGIITFNDVDLAPEELFIDFAHQPLAPRPTLGTVGLWCALHGEAFLQAGMHHLECQFDFAALKTQLESHHITVMKPFTDFPHLRQAFTEGERWPVAESRLQTLLAQKLITPDQAEKFRTQGAIGSHLENLERNDGYKGFNQKGVSEIISATDPRHH